MNLPRLFRNFFLPTLILLFSWMPYALSTDISNAAVAVEQAEFKTLGIGPIQMAVLNGNPETGPSAVFLKFPPNFPGSMHSHTSGYHAIVVSGASKHWLEGQNESDVALQQPGDYWYQIGGQPHQDSFPTDEPTVIYVQFEGPMDVLARE